MIKDTKSVEIDPKTSQSKADKNFEKKENKVWHVIGDNVFKPSGDAVIMKKIPAGYYNLNYSSNIGNFIEKQSFINDDYIHLPIKEFEEIINDINKFWTLVPQFKKYGFIHKRGILLHGKQGNGKSFLMSAIINNLIKNYDGIIFSISSGDDLEVFSSFFNSDFRKIEPDRPVIVTLEDIDGLLDRNDKETNLLNILDGIKHTSNIVYIATTNHIEKLEERIINRPSRFDRRYHIKEADENVRRVFIENKLHKDDLSKINIDEWVKKTEGYSLAHIKELIISVVIYNNSLEDTLAYINEMKQRPQVDTEWKDNDEKTGFCLST